MRPLLLLILCLLTYCTGLTTHGLTNWQEAQRALVAREMQARHDWIVPTVDGRPYLAKPPLIYWSQLSIAALRGSQSGEFELRLTVALAGTLGVLATYFAARRMLGVEPAWWSALFLATGILYARSSRIGEIDILLAPFTAAAVGALYAAWRSHLDRARTSLPAVLLATVAATGAMLAKGPPALLAMALAGYGSILLREAWSNPAPRTLTRAGALLGALSLGGATVWFNRAEPWSAADIAGVGIFALMGAAAGATIARLLDPARLRSVFIALSRTHPIAVLGVPALALWGWGQLVTARIGAAAVSTAVRTETLDNLRLLVPESPINNLEAIAYGVGLGSLAALAAAVWLIHRRIRPTPAHWVLYAWTIGGFCAFSLLGKGVVRYLTPIWPGVAMLGAVWFEHALARVPRPNRLRAFGLAAVLALAIAQAWWYGWERERRYGDRSPRALVAELLRAPGFDPRRLSSFEFESPALDYYAGARVDALADIVPRPGLVGVGPSTIGDLRAALARDAGASWTLLIRRTQPSNMVPAYALDRLEQLGITADPIPLRSRFTIDNGRTEVAAVRIRSAAPVEPPALDK